MDRKVKLKPNSRFRFGITLVEVLVATAIISVSLIGMVSSWLYMIGSAVTTDERAAGYICARTTIERAKINGYFVVQPSTVSFPAAGNSRSSWISTNLQSVRYFDDNLEEMQLVDRVRPPALYARYRVITSVNYSPPGTYPAGRDDLRTMTVTVVAYQNKTNAELARLQTCMVQGGI